MGSVKTAETRTSRLIRRDQLVTLEDLEEFKYDLLISIRKILLTSEPANTKKWLKTYEVRKLLGISKGTLQRLKNKGTLPFSKIGGTIYYDADEVDNMLEGIIL